MHNASNAHFPRFLDAFTKYDVYKADKSLNYNCQEVLEKKLGVPHDTIEQIRSIMIPGYVKGTAIPEPEAQQVAA